MKNSIWILYEKKDYEINTSFVKMLCDEIAAFSEAYEGKLILIDRLSFGIKEGKLLLFYEGVEQEKPYLVISRARDFRLSRRLEQMGIRVCNSSYVCEICNDKAATYEVAASLGLPIPETYFGEEGFNRLQYPYVVKSVDGHGGTEVFLVQDDEKRKEIQSFFTGRRFVVQRLVSDVGIDVRVYVCGGKILQAMKRQSKQDFRSNFCLGGEASCYTLSEEMKTYVECLQEHFGFDYAGIDFIFDQGKPILNEIEDVVGARMLYTYTDLDVVKSYVSYLLS